MMVLTLSGRDVTSQDIDFVEANVDKAPGISESLQQAPSYPMVADFRRPLQGVS